MPEKIVPFSKKQRQVLSWWHPESPVNTYDGIICDGSIRAGKTFPFGISFVAWAFHNFEDQNFAICGKSVGAIYRNVLIWLLPLLRRRGYTCHEKRTRNLVIITYRNRTNYFYYFGGKDESSQDLIQGMTLAGVLLDEVALMPESFVNQITGRCSVEGAKFWFNCNPEGPSHYFKLNWLDQADAKNMIHIHFNMDDNPSLSDAVKARYKGLYSGVFYQRMILGLWVMAEGAIYDMFLDHCLYSDDALPDFQECPRWREYIAIDYGTQNATVFLHIIDDGEKVWVHDEWYHSGRESQRQKTDAEYADALREFMEWKRMPLVIMDPSAASFKAELRKRGLSIKAANNDVLNGIRNVQTMFQTGRLLVNKDRCKNLIRELQGYVWDKKACERGKEEPLKTNDHGPDALRYYINTMIPKYRIAGPENG